MRLVKHPLFMVDETTDVSNVAQHALVLHYVTDTRGEEWFVRFEGVKSDDIAALIVRFLEEYECPDKVVAQCFDGAPVMSLGLNGVQAKVKERNLWPYLYTAMHINLISC